MSYEFYKVVHVLGILLLFTALGALAVHVQRGATDEEHKPLRKFLAMVHGIAMLVILVGGFGLMARKGIMTGAWPTWIYIKVALWIALGGSVALVRRKAELGKVWLIVLPLVGATAAYVAVYQPGS
jgi:cytochrome bd-type quinol oxidase subunit 2